MFGKERNYISSSFLDYIFPKYFSFLPAVSLGAHFLLPSSLQGQKFFC